MTKEISIRIEFNTKSESIKFDALFQSKCLGHYDPARHIVDFAIVPLDKEKYFTDKDIEAFLSECDEKLKSYEIIEIKETEI